MDTTHKQIDYLGEVITRVESQMIDPVQFGELRGAVTSLKSEVDQIRNRQASMDAKLDLLLDKLSEAKGGWRALLLLGGAGATLGGVVTWFASHTLTIGPR